MSRILHVTLTDETAEHVFSQFAIPLADTCLEEDATNGDIFRAMQQEYGRCTSRVYQEKSERPDTPIGWFFISRQQYTNTQKSYLRGAWVWVTSQPERTEQHV